MSLTKRIELDSGRARRRLQDDLDYRMPRLSRQPPAVRSQAARRQVAAVRPVVLLALTATSLLSRPVRREGAQSTPMPPSGLAPTDPDDQRVTDHGAVLPDPLLGQPAARQGGMSDRLDVLLLNGDRRCTGGTAYMSGTAWETVFGTDAASHHEWVSTTAHACQRASETGLSGRS